MTSHRMAPQCPEPNRWQAARKKLDARRLAYDTSLAKMQKVKKEDFRVEEELRAQKAKYEESSEDVFRRMQDIKEAEMDLVHDLTDFLEAELTYYDRCREILLNVKRDWPVKYGNTCQNLYVQLTNTCFRDTLRPIRSRSNTAHGYAERFNPPEEEPVPEPPRVTIPRLSSRNISPSHDSIPSPVSRPPYGRTVTHEGSSRSQSQREMSPVPRMTRIPTEPTAVLAHRAGLRPVRQTNTFADDYAEDYAGTNGHRRDRSPPSPATSQGSVLSRTASWSQNSEAPTGKKAPPPPPPSRSKKPPPPPPPMKRSTLSSSETSHY